MTEEQLKAKTRALSLEGIRIVGTLRRGVVASHCGRQLLRCATSVGANYRAACRARSDAEMAAKLGIVEEEADECLFWLDLLVATKELEAADVAAFEREANQILGIVVNSIKTLRNKGIVPTHITREVRSGYDPLLEEAVFDHNPQSTIHN